MIKFKKHRLLTGMILMTAFLFCTTTLLSESKTNVSIRGEKWFINNKIVNKGSPAEGLLMNVRMVNSVFEDRGNKIPTEYKDFDAEKNTDEFIAKIPEYVGSGVNGFTISLQGGMPGYEGAINIAFEPDGTLRPSYMERVARVIREADRNSAIIILTCFYQRQHSHPFALTGREAIRNAVSNTVKWINQNNFRNVTLEISNEYRHGGFRNWNDGKWLISAGGQAELMKLAKSLNPQLLVSSSGMGDGLLNDTLNRVADYISVHFNSTPLEKYGEKIRESKKTGKPVVCNEDDKIGKSGAGALLFSVLNGCGWGFMHNRQNQTIPFRFEGIKDDTATYHAMKNVTTPGYKIDNNLMMQPSILIFLPKDGDIVTAGQDVNVKYSYIAPDPSKKFTLKLYANNREAMVTKDIGGHIRFKLQETGVIFLTLALFDEYGKEILRSPKSELLVK